MRSLGRGIVGSWVHGIVGSWAHEIVGSWEIVGLSESKLNVEFSLESYRV
jgi:hypothetical protein